jgi:hypothetical protein
MYPSEVCNSSVLAKCFLRVFQGNSLCKCTSEVLCAIVLDIYSVRVF